MKKKALLQEVQKKLPLISEKKITLGFDGFIDTVLTVVKSKDDRHSTTYFNSIGEFAEYITIKGERSFFLELEEQVTKLGGNMPNMANALSMLGSHQSCVGAMGYPQIHPIFRELSPNNTLYSFADPGITTALEFRGNKIILAEIGGLNRVTWENIKSILGYDKLVQLFTNTDLVGMLNWGEFDRSTEIWTGLLTEILPATHVNLFDERKPLGFFDLADCSKRTRSNIAEAIGLVQSFSRYWNVVLSLSMNEAMVVNEALTQSNDEDIEEIGSNLYNLLDIHCLIIHHAMAAVAWDEDGIHKVNSYFVPHPKISTGAGDNFNAGFCAGKLIQLDTPSALTLGHATSSCYMKNGSSPTARALTSFLSKVEISEHTRL